MESTYHRDWTLIKCLKKGIGIHHGQLPRAISQYIIFLFNRGFLNFLICTSTIIEGVNTTARNIIIWDKKLGNNNYDIFTFNNIAGRAGRMFEHFVGNVYVFNKKPEGDNLQLDFLLFNQDKADNNLLLSLDKDVLSDKSRKRIEKIDIKPLNNEIIKKISIDKEKAVEFSKNIKEEDLQSILQPINPYNMNFDSIKILCELIWRLFPNPSQLANNSARTSDQLAFYINTLKNKKMSYDIDDYHDTVDKKINNFTAFQRNWAQHHIPSALNSMEIIINHLFPNKNIDFKSLVNAIENLYSHRFLIILDEYGLPIQIGEKYKKSIVADNFEGTITNLENLNIDNFKGFEKDIFEFVKEGLKK